MVFFSLKRNIIVGQNLCFLCLKKQRQYNNSFWINIKHRKGIQLCLSMEIHTAAFHCVKPKAPLIVRPVE